MRGLVILLLLPLFLGDSTPELVSDSSETAPTCRSDSDCRDGYNSCIDGECQHLPGYCKRNSDCDTNCCFLNSCVSSAVCNLCSSDSDCYETNCCKNYECVASSECSLSALAIFIIVAVVVIIVSAGIVFACIRRSRRYSSAYSPPPAYIPPPAYVH